MDRPPLHAFVHVLAANERFQAFAKALPARARVSEPALPLLLATLYTELGRSLLIVLPEDADARDAADAASWYLGPDAVALLPSRGVSPSSGLEPPPHLVRLLQEVRHERQGHYRRAQACTQGRTVQASLTRLTARSCCRYTAVRN